MRSHPPRTFAKCGILLCCHNALCASNLLAINDLQLWHTRYNVLLTALPVGVTGVALETKGWSTMKVDMRERGGGAGGAWRVVETSPSN